MNAPKKRHSDDRKIHIASLVLVVPVAVSYGSCSWCAGSRERGLRHR